MSVWESILAALAAWRLTQLVLHDRILRPIRSRVFRWSYERLMPDQPDVWGLDHDDLPAWEDLGHSDDEAPPIVYLLSCWWCSGLWISTGWWLFHEAAPGVARAAAYPLALSAALVLLERVESLLRARSGA